MKIRLETCDYKKSCVRFPCDNENCDRSEEHITFAYPNKLDRGAIRDGTTFAVLTFKKEYCYIICRGCIDKEFKVFEEAIKDK